jgi:thiol-disulfide isomerase/thioredoxin
MLNARVYAAHGRHAMRWIGIVLLAAGCSSRPMRTPIRAIDAVIPHTPHTYAVLVNGGGRPEVNYQSHLQHVQGMVELLEANGMRREDITVFSGDGSDPALDLATRERSTEADYWLIPQYTPLRPPIVFVNSAVDGIQLQAARKDTLRAWFDTQGAGLRHGDTLLFYVTDHGHRNDQDLANNTIVLWGEELSVTELREMLGGLDPRVRVVMLMSQCYTGSFANAIFKGPGATLPEGNVCGYFASTAERPAYGCYPENKGKDGVGHSFTFMQALQPLGGFPEANRRVLVTDSTPDVPHTSSDFFLNQLLHQKAEQAGKDPNGYIDEQLAEAWRNRGAWEPDIRLLDRIGLAFGSFSARSLAELDEQSRALPELSKQLDLYAQRWKQALESLKAENLKLFIDAHPAWGPRLDPAALNGLDATLRRALAGELLGELVPFTKAATDRYQRLLSLKQKADEASAASYRVEVRLGTVLRMRSLLTNVAGRQYITARATPEERAAYERLHACENLTLNDNPAVASAAQLEAPKPFPPLADEQRTVEAVMPAWMGITYAPLSEAQQKKYDTQNGAVMTRTIFPDSPATVAGLQVGDIITGPPRSPFAEPNQVREWTMRSEIGKPERLAIVRDGKPLLITLRPGPYPLELPKLPGPPQVGSTAPPVMVDLLKGPKRLADSKPRLLFFWATWCSICKTALPEVLAFSEARDVEIVAISDEEPTVVRDFLKSYAEPFPSIVATDRNRLTFQNFGVSGLPTVVLVDRDGVVQHFKAGYTRQGGLGIDGWKWNQDAPAVSVNP